MRQNQVQLFVALVIIKNIKNNAAVSSKTMMKSVLYNGAVKEYLEHNYSLENDPKFQKLLPDVMREVYTAYVEDHIKGSEDIIKLFSELGGAYDTQEREKEKIEKAKRLLPDNPEEAARVFMMMGSCHELWGLQKNILKEKYGITWYTPSEVYPHIIFD